jgi:hypothetical protein
LWFRFFIGFAAQQYLEFTPRKSRSIGTEKN